MGEAEQNIVKQAVRFGQPIPDRIKDAPELEAGLQLYFNAFFELESERPEGFSSVRPIPGRAIRQYASDYEFSEAQTERLVFFIRKMDNALLKLKNPA